MNSDIEKACMRALGCLYIAVEKSVADDVNVKVIAHIDQLHARIRELDRAVEIVNSCLTTAGQTEDKLRSQLAALRAEKDADLKSYLAVEQDQHTELASLRAEVGRLREALIRISKGVRSDEEPWEIAGAALRPENPK